MVGRDRAFLGICIAAILTTAMLIGAGCDPLMIEVGPDPTINQGDSVQLQITVEGGRTDYTYAWSPTTGLSDPSIPNPIASPDTSTTYTVTVRDAGDMVEVAQITVFVIPAPTPMTDPPEMQEPPDPPVTLPGNQAPNAIAGATPQFAVDDDGSGAETISLDGTQSTDPDGSIVSYDWLEGTTPIATGPNPMVSLSVGLHTITLKVTDDDDATATANVSVQVAAMLTANAGGDRTAPYTDAGGACVPLAGSATGGSGTYTEYRWSGGPGGDVYGVNTCKLLPFGTHDLTLTVTDSRGVQATDEFTATVLVPAQPDNGLPVASSCGLLATDCTIDYPVLKVTVDPLTIDGEVQTVTVKDTEIIFVDGGALNLNTDDSNEALPKKIIVQRSNSTGPERIQFMHEIVDQFNLYLPDPTFTWYQDGIVFSTEPDPEVIVAPGTHFISLTVDGFVDDFDGNPQPRPLTIEVELNVNPGPAALCAFAGDPLFLAPGGLGVLQGSATGGVPPYAFSWCPAANLVNPLVATPTLTGNGLNETTEYVLTVTDANGSSDLSRVFVVVPFFFDDPVTTCTEPPSP